MGIVYLSSIQSQTVDANLPNLICIPIEPEKGFNMFLTIIHREEIITPVEQLTVVQGLLSSTYTTMKRELEIELIPFQKI